MRIFLVVACLLLLSGCEESKQSEKQPEKVLYVNDFHQAVEPVGANRWAKWLETHRDCKIVSITSFSGYQGTCNPTTEIIVVYEYYTK